MLSIEKIRENSLPQSFEKGEKLHAEGAVRSLVRAGELFNAEVQGSYRYQLTIDFSQEPPYAACSCPFSGSGWCKHLVAAGIAIIKGEVENEVVEDEKEQEEIAFFEDVFLKADEQIREVFLRQLFEQREDMQKAFRLFVEPPRVVSFKQVVDVRRRVEEMLNARYPPSTFISYTIDSLLENGGEYYAGKDAETLRRIATEMEVELLFSEGRSSMDDAIRSMEPLAATAAFIGMIEADRASEAEGDEVFERVKKEFLEEVLHDLIALWVKHPFPSGFYKSGTELIVDRWSFLRARNDKGAFSLGLFEPLLYKLSWHEIPARFLLFRLEAFVADKHEVPFLFVHAAEKAGDSKAFRRYAERFWKEDQKIAKSFLLILKEENEQRFYTKAEEAHALYGERLGWFLRENIDEKVAPELIKSVLSGLIKKEHSISLYQEWRSLASDDQVDSLLNELEEHSGFYLEILTIEEKYEEIRALAKAQKPENLFYYLPPVFEVYPDFCFEKIKSAITSLLAVASNRKTYRLVADLLDLARQIPDYREKANNLHKQYEALGWPALSDELNKPQAGGWTIYADD
jgi:hypothetical protein